MMGAGQISWAADAPVCNLSLLDGTLPRVPFYTIGKSIPLSTGFPSSLQRAIICPWC
jgi:hypothetical protein